MEEEHKACKVFMRKQEVKRDRLQDPPVEGTATLKPILNKQVGRVWTGLIWLGIRTTGELPRSKLDRHILVSVTMFTTAAKY
jgi:hypothetical protein